MIDLRFVPLDIKNFPGGAREPNKRRASIVFSSSYSRTLDRLEYELGRLGARDIVVQAGFKRADLRNDGWPLSKAIPVHPAIVVSFRASTGQEYSFPCDTFTKWEHNLHAIAFTLEALRAVNRYGVTRGHEQYTGFAQLGAPPDTEKWTAEAAAEWLAERSSSRAGRILSDKFYYRESYRAAAARLHPDANSAAGPDWHRLQDAKRLLDQVHADAAEGAS
jgi:hypothetical protein